MIRNEVRERIAELIAQLPEAGKLDVSPYYKGDKHQAREMVFVDRTEGGVSLPYAMAGDRTQRDTFTAVIVVRIAATQGVPVAMERCQEIANEIAFLLAGPTLLEFGVAGEVVTDTAPDGALILVETREGESRTGDPIAIAEITPTIETQTTNGTEG